MDIEPTINTNARSERNTQSRKRMSIAMVIEDIHDTSPWVRRAASSAKNTMPDIRRELEG